MTKSCRKYWWADGGPLCSYDSSRACRVKDAGRSELSPHEGHGWQGEDLKYELLEPLAAIWIFVLEQEGEGCSDDVR